MSRTVVEDSSLRNSFVYEAEIINHLDPYNMGTLEVELLRSKGAGSVPERTGQLLTVRYLSPFYGVTPAEGLKKNDGYEYTQKSYGFWAVPPDVGTRVLVVFAEGSAAYGYWIGCIQDLGMNFMVPDGRASTTLVTENTPSNLRNSKLPVGEYNKEIPQTESDPTRFSKPYNKDFTSVLEVQGLILDETRGTTTTSARREAPSMVFGMSTPGPLDKRNGSPNAKYGNDESAAEIPFNRLGGSSIVMDDGDDKFVRATHAEDGPPFYINREIGEQGGDETIPQNELMRLRTRTGHQILLHNSEDIIYIGNSRGTAWIELTSDGKIDIFANDSISVHSNQDINLSADRDFNVDAGRNINMKASARRSKGRGTFQNVDSGNIHLESAYSTKVKAGANVNIDAGASSNYRVGSSMNLSTGSNYNLSAGSEINQSSGGATSEYAGTSWTRTAGAGIHDSAQGGDLYATASGAIHVNAGEDVFVTAASSIQNQAGTDIYQTASGSLFNSSTETTNDVSGKFSIQGSEIAFDGQMYMNNGLSDFGLTATPAETADTASTVTPASGVAELTTHALPKIFPGAIRAVPFESILRRAPQHEPWPHHENLNPQAFKSESIDREVGQALPVGDRILTPDTFRKNVDGLKNSTTVKDLGLTGFTGGEEYIDYQGEFNCKFSTPTISSEVIEPADLSTVVLPGQTPIPVTYSENRHGTLATIKTKKRGLTTQVAKIFAPYFQGFINDLEDTGYEIKRLGGYACRSVARGTSWSYHASGAAIDINWPDPPVSSGINGYQSPRPANAPNTDMPNNTLDLAEKWGLGWGGDWNSIDDPMHFSIARSEHKNSGGQGMFEVIKNGVVPLSDEDDLDQLALPTKTDNGVEE